MIKYIIENVIVPLAKAVANALIQAAGSAASTAISGATLGMGGQIAGSAVSSLITGVGSAGVDVFSEIASSIGINFFDTLIDVLGGELLSSGLGSSLFGGGMNSLLGLLTAPFQLLTAPLSMLFGGNGGSGLSGGLLGMLTAPLQLLMAPLQMLMGGFGGGGGANIFGGLLGSLTGLLTAPLKLLGGGLFAPLLSLFGGLASFDSGGVASGIGFMPKATLQPERVLSPSNTIAFDKLPDRLDRLARALEGNQGVGNYVHAPITVMGGAQAGEQVRESLMELMRG